MPFIELGAFDESRFQTFLNTLIEFARGFTYRTHAQATIEAAPADLTAINEEIEIAFVPLREGAAVGQ